MANIPGMFHMPYCDPPLQIIISGSDGPLIRMDEDGIKFELVGDKNLAAIALLEYGLSRGKVASSHDYYSYRVGPVDFIFLEHQLERVEPYFKELERPELLEMIQKMNAMNAALKMKVFL